MLAPLLSALLTVAQAAAQANTPAPALVAKIDRIIVMPFVVAEGVSVKTAALLNEAYMSSLAQVVPSDVKLVGAADITAMLGQAEQRRMVNCDDNSCLAEIGLAVGASHMIGSSLGKVGGRFLLSTKLVNVNNAVVLYRNTLFLSDDEAAVVDGLQTLAKDMAAKMGWQAGSAQATAAPVGQAPGVSTSQPAGTAFQPGLFFWTSLGAAGVGVVGAAIGGGLLAYFDARAGDGTLPYRDRQNQLTGGLVALVGTSLAAALGVAGGGLAVASLVTGGEP